MISTKYINNMKYAICYVAITIAFCPDYCHDVRLSHVHKIMPSHLSFVAFGKQSVMWLETTRFLFPSSMNSHLKPHSRHTETWQACSLCQDLPWGNERRREACGSCPPHHSFKRKTIHWRFMPWPPLSSHYQRLQSNCARIFHWHPAF